jgi:hypothetical protein
MRGFRLAPVTSFAIGAVALAVALSGTAYAAGKINGKHIAKHSIAGNRLKPDSLTGAQIDESKLGTVPAAKAAGNAYSVDGRTVTTFRIVVGGSGPTQHVQIPGALLTAACPTGTPDLTMAGTADTVESDVTAGNDAIHGSFGHNNLDFTTASHDDLTPFDYSGTGIAVINRPNQSLTTITYSYGYNDDLDYCFYSGSVVAS